jgi:hypothetical protein
VQERSVLGLRFAVLTISEIRNVVLYVMPCSLVGGIDVSEKRTTSMFRVYMKKQAVQTFENDNPVAYIPYIQTRQAMYVKRNTETH